MESNAYEAERELRIERNKERLRALQIPQLSETFRGSLRRNNPAQRKPRPVMPAQKRPIEQRRSGRLVGKPAPDYNDAVLQALEKHEEGHPRISFRNEEVYTEEHVKALGSCVEDWELFKDGYDGCGNRIYCKESGLTCHQCRQKTLGVHTSCSLCNSLKGVFCGDCLFMRYGENIKEANAKADWVCPPCRDICNCSIHRIRKGWAPTGSMYRQAIAAGFKSVAHYIILNNVAKPENESEPAKVASKTNASSQEPVSDSAADKELQTPQEFSPATAQPFTQLQITNMLPQKRRRASSKAVGKAVQSPGVVKAVGLDEGCKRATRLRAGKIMPVQYL